MRILHRRFGRDGKSPHATGATGVIKIGFDARGRGDNRPKPGKLAGFLLCKDAIDGENNLMVDNAAMLALGAYDAATIAKAKSAGIKGVGLLPTALNFVIVHEAMREVGSDGWQYPGTFEESYECWNGLGLFCAGDGSKARRKQDDQTRKEVECVPVGREDHEAIEFCPYSVKKECKAHSRLILCLFTVDENGRPQPVNKSLGWNARYRFDTSSEYNAQRVLHELDMAAERLNGHIANITGTLVFAVQRKRTGLKDQPVGIVGQVMFQLSESDIRAREEKLRNYRLEDQRAQLQIEDRSAQTKQPAAPQAVAAQGEAISPFEADGFQIVEEEAAREEAIVDGGQVMGFEPNDTAPEPDNSEAIARIAALEPEQLISSIVAYAQAKGVQFSDVAWFEFISAKTGKAMIHRPEKPEFFFEGKPQDTEQRIAKLREACVRLVNTNTGFYVPEMIQAAEAVTS